MYEYTMCFVLRKKEMNPTYYKQYPVFYTEHILWQSKYDYVIHGSVKGSPPPQS